MHIKNFELARKGIKTNAMVTRGTKTNNYLNNMLEPESKQKLDENYA